MTERASQERPHLYLIDGSGYIFRAYHALPPMTTSEGTPTNAVFGFTNMLYKLLQDAADGDKPTHLAVIFDTARRSFRNDIYDDYKANRPPPPEDLIPQFPLIRDATRAFNVPSIEQEGYEADDIIATYVRQAKEQGWNVTIISSDKDLMQLVNDEVIMLDTMKNRRIGPEQVKEKFGLGPDKVVEVQALCGDSSDNVPGVPGIGPKTAAQLIAEYGDLESLLSRAEEIKQPKRRQNLIEFADQARISKELVTLHPDVPVAEPLADLAVRDPDADALIAFVDELQFDSLKSRLIARLGLDEDDGTGAGDIGQGETDYECVTSLEALDRWISAAEETGVVAIDTETTDLNGMRARLVGVSMSVEAGKACYIPLRHTAGGKGGELELNGPAPEQIQADKAIARLKPLFEDPAVLKIGQNMKYDFSVLAGEGIRVAPIDDTMLISYVLDAGLHGHGMDELAERHLGITPIAYKDLAGSGKNQLRFDQIPLEKASDYAAEDADITGRLHRLLKPRLAEAGLLTVYETLERPLAPVIADMERAGIKVDRDVLHRLSNDFAEGMAALEQEIHELAGHPFNIGSPKQLGEILFDEMGLKGGKRGKTGAYSTGADVLDKLAADGHELPAKVLEWRQLAKLKSTYTDTLQEDILPETGRVHTSFSMAATSTGRLASSDPNLQNIPIRTEEGRKIRRAFIAENGCRLIAADYSQIELRIFAHMADIDALKQAFADGLDIHAMTASEVFGVPMKDMDPVTRRKAKAINFGIIYGISAYGLARQLDTSRTEAKDYIDTYFKRFPGIRDYMDSTIEFCRHNGYVETLFGRRCHMRGINDKNPSARGFAERAAINAPIQGTAADIIRRAMARMPSALAEAGFSDVAMLLQVHDELIFEAREDQVDGVSPVIAATMREAPDPVVALDVPLVVDCGVGRDWEEAH